ncbi:SDR family oxidoreductase [Nocardioides sp. KIGAM211]|uniref:SDR family oxidoreductase n=1 Tax=Nocardioides luti TaxID=2761101 RepID=A0A7X0RFX5_9ACTN|nr:SDR family oxidoreductase [Nocardioides luti]
MQEKQTQGGTAHIVGSGSIATEIVHRLEAEGWTFVDEISPETELNALVFAQGLAESEVNASAATSFVATVEQLVDRFHEGHARVVALVGREVLGWPTSLEAAVQAGGIASAARSLALKLARRGITVNVVVANLDDLEPDDDAQGVLSDWPAPKPLTLRSITPRDVADAVQFFVDARSGYITGQQFYVCGGSSLVSSLSV